MEKSKDELLLELETKLTQLESMTNIGTWEYHFSDQKLSWSGQMFNIFERDTTEGHPNLRDVHEKIHVSDQIHWELMINRASVQGQKNEIEFRIFNKKDEIRWILKTAMGIFKNSELVGIHGVCQDITEIKQLRNHFELTKQLLEMEK